MQDTDVRRIDMRFHPLQPVIVNDRAPGMHVTRRKGVELELREGRSGISLSEIDPDHAARFPDGVVINLQACSELFAPVRGLARCVDDLAFDGHFPAVKNTTQTVLLISR